jgi:hypothetical protein
MSLRPVLVAVCLAVAFVISGYLLYTEQILSGEKAQRHIVNRTDPLIALRYTKGRREQNLAAFGLDERTSRRAQEQMRDLDDKWGEKLDRLMLRVGDPNAIADALCGQTNQLRPRYGALRFFVTEKGDQRHPIRLGKISGLEFQDWARTAPISEVYTTIELIDNPKEDATLMGVAAIIEKHEEDVFQNHPPWGTGLFPGSWSWSRVLDGNPGVGSRVTGYFALMHLALERAREDEGICEEKAGTE